MQLENLLIGVAILLPSLFVLSSCVRLCGKRMNFRLQLLALVVFAGAVLGSFYFMFGKEVALYLISGLSLGIGIALRPVFSKVLCGMIFDATHIYESKGIAVGNVKGRVVRVGLLHTWVMDEANELYMVSNTYLEQNPVKVTLNEKDKRSLRLKSPTPSLRAEASMLF